jgi:hypothetical protein
LFLALGIFSGIFGGKKKRRGTLLLDPLAISLGVILSMNKKPSLFSNHS